MATLTIRNVPDAVIASLKSRARTNQRSMEQEVRVLLEQHAADRQALINEIKASWARQTRPTTAEEIEEGIRSGRP